MKAKYTLHLKNYGTDETETRTFIGTEKALIDYIAYIPRVVLEKCFKDGKEHVLEFQKDQNKVYFLHLMYITDPNDPNDVPKHKHFINHFDTQEAAEQYLKIWWFNLHEQWVNTACIEERFHKGHPRRKKWWYRSEDFTQTIPSPIDEPLYFKNIGSII